MRLTSRARPCAAAALAAAVTLSLAPAASAAAGDPTPPLFGTPVPMGAPDIHRGHPGDGRTTIVPAVDRRGRPLAGGTGARLPEGVAARAAQPR
ncbi:MAG: hypothetical protein JWN87_3091, partial [Frankiales bacterium]|nr:hypothetical protein [Frankiales bacterium]